MLKAVLAGAAPTRYFIPFPRDQHLGRVVAFDPPKVELSTNLRESVHNIYTRSLICHSPC